MDLDLFFLKNGGNDGFWKKTIEIENFLLKIKIFR